MATSDRPACDIVMKGGITSGVVYPLALVELSEKYRFANIGGTSAGAIAAAAAAAAEFGRAVPGAGFERLKKVPDEVGPHLLSLFQPAPALKPLFDIFIAAQGAKTRPAQVLAVVAAAIRGYWPSALLGLLPGAVIVGVALYFHRFGGTLAFGILLALVGLVVALLWRLLKAAGTDLVNNDFGVCPGIRQSPTAPEAFTDWLARLIQEAAGRKITDDPLTFGDLERPPGDAPAINLAMITTSLMEERPYTLPMQPTDHRRFFFRPDEWAHLFPKRVLEFLVSNSEEFNGGKKGEFYYFPDRAQLPVIVAARMSLSFPGLISAVPLWSRDFTLKPEYRDTPQRCLFSDGGLTSNFPIHFFDHPFPNSPTFAISLDDYDARRSRDDVWLPSSAFAGWLVPILPFQGLGGFLARLLYSAKDWQDNLQSTLPGYRERIVHVVLKPDEGGLNLTMTDATVQKLVDYGKKAGQLLRDSFVLEEHRWRRFLVSMARMEQSLDEVAAAYEQDPGKFGEFLDKFVRERMPYRSPKQPGERPPNSQDTEARVDEMLKRARQLVELGVAWRNAPTIRNDDIPKPGTNLRITPKY